MDDKTNQVVRLILTAKEMIRAVKEKDYGFAEHLLTALSDEIRNTEVTFNVENIAVCA